MPGQKSILNFLKPAASKRLSDNTGNENLITKRLKTEDEDSKSSQKIITESPELSKTNAVVWPNAILAKIKLTSKKCCALHSNIGRSWFQALEPEFKSPYFSKLSDFLQSERSKSTVYPPEEKVWTWTRMCPISDIKVVILGQDPYHNPGQAHGLCFSVPVGIAPPPSLLNMYKELETDIPGFITPKHGNLSGWARQGVLLLNACLTVRQNCPNSHKDQGWENLTDAVIKHLSANYRNIVFLLWGSYAQKKAAAVDKKKHHLLKAPHPSPLSAHRGFLGCKHFSQCNKLLEEAGKKPINWSDLPENIEIS